MFQITILSLFFVFFSSNPPHTPHSYFHTHTHTHIHFVGLYFFESKNNSRLLLLSKNYYSILRAVAISLCNCGTWSQSVSQLQTKKLCSGFVAASFEIPVKRSSNISWAVPLLAILNNYKVCFYFFLNNWCFIAI